jgi:transposase
LAKDLAAQKGLSQLVYGLEPTGVYHKPLLEYLIRQGEVVVQVSNVAVEHNRRLLDGRWDKNDTSDTANVADLVSQARCLFPDSPTQDLRELRTFVRFRARMKKHEHALRMRIRNNLVAQYFPELELAYTQNGGDKLVVAIVRSCFDPAEIARMDFDAFWEKIAEPTWRQHQQKRARAVWEAAATSIGCILDNAARIEARFLAKSLDVLRVDLDRYQMSMIETAQRLPGYDNVTSIPGVGPVLASMILAAIGDPCRFEHPRQVLRLAGLDLCARRSGKTSDQAIARISKQGKPALRYALVQAAMIASRSHPAIRSYYSKWLNGREHERGIQLKMRVKLASKLLVVAWTLMKRGDMFRPDPFMD